MDRDRSGELSFEEVKRAMNDYRISHTDEEIEAIFDIFDSNHSGSISY
jgi:Ca2+-binding EF-hand superfamily protein